MSKPGPLPRGERVPMAGALLDGVLDVAIDAARAAGREALARFRLDMAVDNKAAGGAFDPVTEADRAAETAIRARVRSHYPEHGLYGEEHGHEPGRSPVTWVIDPIDGTRAFISGMLHWGVMLAVNDGAEPVVGVVHQPFTDELFIGFPGGAEYRRGDQRRPLRVRACASLGTATLATTGVDFLPGDARLGFERLAGRVRLTRYGGDCYIYCLLAMGQIDVVAEWGLAVHDVQPLIPILRGAGGLLTSWDGGDASGGGSALACGDARVHAAAMRVLGERQA
jgi:myo-inositol-1(or 4)-monophosphatase